MTWPHPQRILVVGPAWVGDMVMTQSLLILLKQRHADAQIDVLAPAWTRPLLSRMPEVHDTVSLPFKHGDFHPIGRLALGKTLRPRDYDWAIVLPIAWKAALVPFGARIPRRTGFLGEARWGLLNDTRSLDKQAWPMMAQRYLALGLKAHEVLPTKIPQPALTSTPEQRRATLARLSLHTDERPILALCPGAEYGPAKRWPLEHFANVAKEQIALGWQVWIFGSAKDVDQATRIATQLDPASCVNLAGKTQLEEAIDLLAIATAVVTNDSGLMHVAAALGRRVIAVYGSSDPGYTPPLSPRASIVSIHTECSPCFKKECPLGHYRCLRELQPEKVTAQINEQHVGVVEPAAKFEPPHPLHTQQQSRPQID